MSFTLKVARLCAPLLLAFWLASCTPPSGGGGTPGLPKAGCYDNTGIGDDVRFSGALGTNVFTFYTSTNGTCAGWVSSFAGVQAASLSEADARCTDLGKGVHYGGTSGDLASIGFPALTNMWICELP